VAPHQKAFAQIAQEARARASTGRQSGGHQWALVNVHDFVSEVNYQKHIAHGRRRSEPLPEPVPEK